MNGKKAKAIRHKAREFTKDAPERTVVEGRRNIRYYTDKDGKKVPLEMPRQVFIDPKSTRGAVRGIKRAVRRLGV